MSDENGEQARPDLYLKPVLLKATVVETFTDAASVEVFAKDGVTLLSAVIEVPYEILEDEALPERAARTFGAALRKIARQPGDEFLGYDGKVAMAALAAYPAFDPGHHDRPPAAG